LKTKKIKIGVDVTALIYSNKVTGIERVIVETNKNLFKVLDSEVYELHPFTVASGIEGHEHIHPYLLSDPVFTKPLVELRDCDILLFGGINLNIPFKEILDSKKKNKIKILSFIYDILPLTYPESLPDAVTSAGRAVNLSGKNFFRFYLQAMFSLSDHVILNSKHVEDEISRLRWNVKPTITVIPLGAFDSQVMVSRPITSACHGVYVSTLAARKGHEELLDAFNLLWDEGFDCTLTLIGGRGWKIDAVLEKIENHPLKDIKLFWRQNLVDFEVDEIYAASNIAFCVSEAEGFGLSLEEGLSKGLKVIARDIPVFRERDYLNLYFFSGGAKELSDKIREVSVLPTKPLKPNEIRTMTSFANDVSQIIKLL
jgi:glycosyltransferase involved in cell wall biosynthesis